MKFKGLKKAFYRIKFEGKDAPFPFSVRSAGHYALAHNSEEHKLPRPFIQFFWVIGGEGRVVMEKKTYPVKPNDAFYYLDNEKHIISVTGDYLEYRWFTFDGPSAFQIMSGFKYPGKPFFAGKCPENLFETLEQRIENSTIAEMRNLTTVAWQIISMAGAGHNISSEEDRILNSFFQVVQRNYFNPNLNVNNIARSLKIHRSTLTRIVSNHTGMTPGKYVHDFRLQKALEMLRDSDLSANEIADKCGYTNACYFSRIIKSAVGFPPLKYRRQYMV